MLGGRSSVRGARRVRGVSTTELTLVTGERYVVDGDREQVEKTILAAARGSLMQFAWLEETGGARALGVVPAHVVSLRPLES
jgi:hypothetical protein